MRRGDDVGQVTRMSIGLRNGVTDWVTKKSEQGVHWLDTIAQIFFPCAFGIFNIIYWSSIYSKISNIRYIIYRWWTKILSVTNDTTFYVGYFFSFWRIPIGWLTGQILTPIYIGCYFFVYFATKKKKKKTYVKSSSEKILVHGQAVFAFALPSKQIIILYLLLDIFILKNMF